MVRVTTVESVYYLSYEEYRNATQNGSLNHLGDEEIISVAGEKKVDWLRVGY